MLTLLFSFFFFYGSGDHRDLHSFPTRRSSDLAAISRSPWRSSRSSCPRNCRSSPRRSEEHTSELQSRQYLVCRLLLEKKKNTNKASSRTTLQTTTNSEHSHRTTPEPLSTPATR